MSTVATLKEQAQSPAPLLLVAFTFTGQSTPSLLLATVPVTLASGIGILPAGFYDGRIAQQDIDSLQYRSIQGIDRAAKIQIHMYDADRFLWDNYVLDRTTGTPKYGFRGATVQMALIMWQPGTTTFSDDAPIVFVGTCDMEVPQHGGDILMVAANNSHDMQTVKLPQAPIQSRCPWIFPPSAANHIDALKNPSSPYYNCGYSAGASGGLGNKATTGGPANDGKSIIDQFGTQVTDVSGNYVYCDYTRSTSFLDQQGHTCPGGCMARLGNSATTSVAPDGDLMHDKSSNRTGSFGGIEWSPGTYYAIVKNYTSNSKIPAFSFLNQAVLGQFHNLLYGTQFVNPKIANVLESGNDTTLEAMICTGDIGTNGVNTVVVNGVQVGQAPSGDPNLWWSFANGSDGHGGYTSTGGRTGISTHIANTQFSTGSSSALGDPYGNIARIVVDIYKDIFSGFGVPTVQVLATGPQIWIYAAIGSISASGSSLVITWPSGYENDYFSGPAVIFGNSNSALNVSVGVNTSSTSTTITFSSSASGSGTGGYIGQLASSFGNSPANENSAWVTLDLLLDCNWALSEINVATFARGATFCSDQIEYVNNVGVITSHPRFKSKFSLETRRSAGEVIAAVLRSFNGYLFYDQAGLLCLGISRPLADEQPVAITGSNYNTAVASTTAQFKGVWNTNYTYGQGDVVTLSTSYYQSNVGGNSGHNPSSSPTQWLTYSRPQGFFAYLFDESNISRVGTGDNEYLDVTGEQNATLLTPNEIFIQFQDEDNSYVMDSLGQIDASSVTRAGGALQPGGSLIPETLTCLGIPNMDQAIRIANTYIAERQYGNPALDPRGTIVYTVGTTVKAEHLRTGHIVGLSLQSFGYVKQPFRVIKVQPATNFAGAKVTIQYHNDIIYTDLYQQAPLTKASNVATSRPGRAPLPWQPNGETPQGSATAPLWASTEKNFELAVLNSLDAQGNPSVSLQVSGYQIVNQIGGTVQPPIVPSFGTVGTGGSLSGPLTVMVQLCAIDVDGNYSAPSAVVTTFIGSGVTGASITIGKIGWLNGSNGYDLFAGVDHFKITHQSVDATHTPSSITINSLPNVLSYGPPDLAAYTEYVQVKLIIHGGLLGDNVVALDSTHITIGAPPSGTFSNTVTGYKIMLLGRLNNQNVPIIEFTITSYTVNGDGSVKYLVDRDPSSLLQIGDTVVLATKANIATSTTIGDSNIVNAYSPTGIPSYEGTAGFMVRIISGTGRYQIRSIVGVPTTASYTISPPWTVTPDSTSFFIVENHTWFYSSDTTQIACSSYSDQQIMTVPVGNLPRQTALVQILVADPTGNLFSSQYRSPIRMIWLSGSQGTRVVGLPDVALGTNIMVPTDGIILFDTTGISQPAATSLTAAITSTSATGISIASGANVVNGTYIQIDSERMYVTDGAGTTTLTVDRGQLTTSAATHSNGASVTVPGELSFGCLQISTIPNQKFTFQKTSSDINYAVINAFAGDTFPGGGTSIVLADDADRGTSSLTAPGSSPSV